MKKLIVHVANIEISEQSGMGRIAWHWKSEFEKRGYEFIHIGSRQVGQLSHPALFPYAAFQAYCRMKKTASLLLLHEPTSGIFLKLGIPTALFSHGIERRAWNLSLQGRDGTNQKLSFKTKLFFPLWRLRQCDIGLKKANLILLSNQEDSQFAQIYYNQNPKQIFVFKNGTYPLNLDETAQKRDKLHILFNASWINRKGIKTLIKSAKILHERNLQIHWLLTGTGCDKNTILSVFPVDLHENLEVIPRFHAGDEVNFLARSQIFVLPSFFEGQPLALLQAMSAGLCCITTNCCGQKDLIRHGYNGLLHEPGDAEKLASLIENCVTDSELRLTLGRNAQASVQNRSWNEVSVEVVDRIEALLNAK